MARVSTREIVDDARNRVAGAGAFNAALRDAVPVPLVLHGSSGVVTRILTALQPPQSSGRGQSCR